jgi:hypothetical protein
LSIKNGTGNADNVTNLLEGLNSGGTTTSFIRADGAFSGTSVFATTISATTYDNLPGSSSSNCQTTFYVTNISGCSPVNMLTEVNMLSGLTVTGAGYFTGEITASTISATTYQNYPTNFTSGLTATTISATTYENLPQSVSGTGTTNYVPKWNDSTGIGDSQIYDDGSVVSIVGTLSATTYSNVPVVTGGTYTSGTLSFNNATGGTFNITGLPVGGQGGQVYYFNTSVSQSPYKEFGPTGTSVSQQSVSITIDSGDTLTLQSYLTPSGYPNSLIIPGGIWSFYLHTYKEDSLSSFDVYCDVYLRTSGGVETYLFSTDPFDVTSIDPTPSMGITDGYFSGKTISTSDRILILVRATNTGDSSKRIWFVTEGTEHYSYGITTFNGIPGNVTSLTTGTGLSGDATTGAITIINTDKGSSQNIFKNIQVAGVTQFSAGSNSSNLNFSGINLTITSAATNTLVFSAGTSSGTVTSVTLATGTSGTDVNVSNPTITTSGTITLNIPDASDTNRGLITTTNQKLKGIKEFVSGITLSNLTASQILALDSLNIVQSLSTATYPSLTELSYVKGVTSAIQTQLNNRVATSGGTINGNLTVTGTTTSATISATTYQNLPVSAATNGTGISTSTSNGVVTITNTGVTSITASSGLSGNSTTGAITLINTQVQGITGVTAGTGISATTTNNVTTITNTQVQGITGVTAGTGISATTTNNVATITNTQVQGITGVTGTSPISAITTNNVTTVSIPDASADGSTKGAATFTAADFNSTSGVISLDYTNGQKASASQPGFLSAANWSTFNNAVFVIRCNISNVSPADGVTYYFNDSSISLSTSATIYRTVIPYACTLIGASIVMQNNATTASNEASTINFRLNNSTDTLLTSGATLGGAPIVVNVYSATSLSTSIAAGDTFNIKWTNPTYVTNPTSAVVVVELFFQRT